MIKSDNQFLATRPIFEHFMKKDQKTIDTIASYYGSKKKVIFITMSCKLLQMLVKPHKMTAGLRKMMAATHLMFAKDQRGDLRSFF